MADTVKPDLDKVVVTHGDFAGMTVAEATQMIKKRKLTTSTRRR